jgi:hypothetical protein
MESRIGFGGVPLGFATDAPRGGAGSFTFPDRDGQLYNPEAFKKILN